MRAVLDAFLPMRCAACAVPGVAWCHRCAAQAEPLRLPGGGGTLLTPAVGAVGVFAYDGVVRDAVRGLKLSGRFAAAATLGEMIRALPSVPDSWPVTWVPSTPARLRARGFELPQLLAGGTARPLLRRNAGGPDQTDLSALQRRRLPARTFSALGAVPPDVVLIDDVRTTGATALAAAQALRDGGARRVLVATFAVGGDDARGAGGAQTETVVS